jgi:hypothetical protein
MWRRLRIESLRSLFLEQRADLDERRLQEPAGTKGGKEGGNGGRWSRRTNELPAQTRVPFANTAIQIMELYVNIRSRLVIAIQIKGVYAKTSGFVYIYIILNRRFCVKYWIAIGTLSKDADQFRGTPCRRRAPLAPRPYPARVKFTRTRVSSGPAHASAPLYSRGYLC